MKLKRYDEFKCWNELEELAVQQEKFDKFIKNKDFSANNQANPNQQTLLHGEEDYVTKGALIEELKALQDYL